VANVLTSNPKSIDAASGSDLTDQWIQQIQWIDDAADIADDDDLNLTINGVTIAAKIQLTANTVNNVAVWTMGPFPHPILANTFVVNTIDHGVLLVWVM
jgi:hypothetical protein